jgi:hypothetical protein
MATRLRPGGWNGRAIALLEQDWAAEVPTPLRRFPLPDDRGVELYLKDESLRATHGGLRRHQPATAGP